MNHSLENILLNGAYVVTVICAIMIIFLVLLHISNMYKNKDKLYKYSRRHIYFSILQGIIGMLFIISIIATLKEKNNIWVLVLFIWSVIVWLVPAFYDFSILKSYKFNEYKKRERLEIKENNLKKSKYGNHNLYLFFGLILGVCFIISAVVYLYFTLKISLRWLLIAVSLLAIALVSGIFIFAVKKQNSNSISINSKINIMAAVAIGALLIFGLNVEAAPEFSGNKNGLSKEVDDLKEKNSKLEGKLEQEEKINQQNKKYLKKTVNENYKTNIYIKNITNNKTINRIIKGNPHDPIKKSPSPKKPPYQDPKGKLPDTGEAKGFWQW